MGEIKDSWNNAMRAGGARHGPRAPKDKITGERISGDRRRARKRLIKYKVAATGKPVETMWLGRPRTFGG